MLANKGVCAPGTVHLSSHSCRPNLQVYAQALTRSSRPAFLDDLEVCGLGLGLKVSQARMTALATTNRLHA